jgi:hypothetical protein
MQPGAVGSWLQRWTSPQLSARVCAELAQRGPDETLAIELVYTVADEMLRGVIPMALEVQGLPVHAARLRALPPVVDPDSAGVAARHARQVQHEAAGQGMRGQHAVGSAAFAVETLSVRQEPPYAELLDMLFAPSAALDMAAARAVHLAGVHSSLVCAQLEQRVAALLPRHL